MTTIDTPQLQLSKDASKAFGTAPTEQRELRATPDTCRWGALDPGFPPALSVEPGTIVNVEAVTHHAGDAPDLLMDDAIRELWRGIPESERGPGVHVITGPIEVRGAEPGDALVVEIGAMVPRLPYGSNCAAHWGLLYDHFGKERITIYELDGTGTGTDVTVSSFPASARPVFGFDFTGRDLYDVPGFETPPGSVPREPFSRPVRVPVRPHFGTIGVAPPDGPRSTIPPGVFGGNVDNWRFGPGARIYFPVFHPGAGLYVGDPHFAQGDGEVCGTAIEASLDAELRVAVARDLPVRTPVLETATHWYTHGFGDDLDAAMRMAVVELLWLLEHALGLTGDDAYSLISVAADVAVTQVVDGTVGCHAGIARDIFL